MQLVIVDNDESKALIKFIEQRETDLILNGKCNDHSSEDYESATMPFVEFSKALEERVTNSLIELFYDQIWDEDTIVFEDLIDSKEEELVLLGHFLKTVKETHFNDIYLMFPVRYNGTIGLVLYPGEPD